MKKSFILYAGVLFVVGIIVSNCARRSTPQGGPKDIIPPVVTNTEPENFNTNFNTNKIRINFDEYIQLKDINNQLIVSPPLTNRPYLKPESGASKYLEIEILDTLKENTTYVLNFGQSIVDNNESNPYPFLQYVFSTGNHIDSLSLGGVISDAVQKKADEYVSVMLYRVDSTYNDSIIYKKPPAYITNTLNSTNYFSLTNLKEGTYNLIALKDKDNNYRFDPKVDKIGFLAGNITIPSDSIYKLNLFKEEAPYNVTRPSLVAKNKILFGYEGDTENMEIKLLNNTPENYTFKTFKDPIKDTIHYFFTPFETDSLVFKVKKEAIIDTFTVRVKELYPDSLQISRLDKNFKLNDSLRLHASTPISQFNTKLITVTNKDTTSLKTTTVLDTLNNILCIKWNTQPNQKYSVVMLPGAITDFYGDQNDTLQYSMTTKSLADLATLRVVLKNVENYPIILQLTDKQENISYEQFITKEENVYEFRNITPTTYNLRIVHDENKNGYWDTGNYLKKIQPERISYYPEEIELRPNWEIEQEFILQ